MYNLCDALYYYGAVHFYIFNKLLVLLFKSITCVLMSPGVLFRSFNVRVASSSVSPRLCLNILKCDTRGEQRNNVVMSRHTSKSQQNWSTEMLSETNRQDTA